MVEHNRKKENGDQGTELAELTYILYFIKAKYLVLYSSLKLSLSFSKGINKIEVVIKFNREFHQLITLLTLRC